MSDMPTMSALAPPEEETTRTEFAGFWRRFVAWFLDGIIVGVPATILTILAMVFLIPGMKEFTAHPPPPPTDPGAVLRHQAQFWPMMLELYAWECVIISGQWLYFALMESSRHQATLGKMAMKLIVTDPQGYPITFGRATGRYFAKMLSSFTLGIGYIMAGFTEKKQALHDMVASTVVLWHDGEH